MCIRDSNNLISYFCEYDFYNNILSAEIRDKRAIDVLLENCKFPFLSAKMAERKAEQILQILSGKLPLNKKQEGKNLIREYVDHRISLQDLFQRLPFTTQKFLGQAKEEVNKIENNHIFYIFYPVYLNRRKHTQQPLFTFTCERLEDSYRIQKVLSLIHI